MYDAASVIIPYHIFLAVALVATAIAGAIVRAVAKKRNPLAPDVYMEFLVLLILLTAYVVLTTRG